MYPQEDKTKKVIFVLFTLFVGFLAVSPVLSQQPEESAGLTLEENLPLESMGSFLMREWGQSIDSNKKMESLEYIRKAIRQGEKSPVIEAALEKLALEGVIDQTRENGRLVDYPFVRARAAIVLGEMGTPESYNTLIRLLQVEYEPMVITEVILALTKINMTNIAARTISQVLLRFDMHTPDNRMAYAALEAFDTLSKKNNGKLDTLTLSAIIRISEGRYSGEVRAQAKALISDLRQY